jgi:glycosyltransferase involved in cell wall biosynthesis
LQTFNPGCTNSANPSRCDLAVLVNEFPRLSETFVLSDLLALESRGLRLHVFSLRRPEVALTQDAVGELRAPVEYFPELQGRQLKLLTRATHGRLFLREPGRYLAGLAEVYASPDYTRSRLQQAVLLARRLDQLGAPPLYIHFAHKPATIGRFAALLLDTPFAVSAHAVDIWTSPVRELRVKLRDASVVLCCYREAQEYVAGIVDGSTPVELAPHGVDIPAAPQRNETAPPLLLSVGRLVEKKGLDTLLRAAALLRKRVSEFRILIAGDGPLWPDLQRLVNELELDDQVRFLGPLTQDELEPYFAGAAAFVLPCQVGADGNRDGLPNTILEAMARGLPVVSTTLASVQEAVGDQREGLLVRPSDPAALAAALEQLLRDPALRERLGRAARERVEREQDRKALAPLVFDALAAAGMVRSGA